MKSVDKKVKSGSTVATSTDLVAAKRASQAKKLQQKAIALAKTATAATSAFNKDAKAAAKLSAAARKAQSGQKGEEELLGEATGRLNSLSDKYEESRENMANAKKSLRLVEAQDTEKEMEAQDE